jgi:hypothetical protein
MEKTLERHGQPEALKGIGSDDYLPVNPDRSMGAGHADGGELGWRLVENFAFPSTEWAAKLASGGRKGSTNKQLVTQHSVWGGRVSPRYQLTRGPLLAPVHDRERCALSGADPPDLSDDLIGYDLPPVRIDPDGTVARWE